MLGSLPLASTSPASPNGTYTVDYYEDISIFLPLEIRENTESDYLSKHTRAFIDNQNSNNDYALLALHHLFMFMSYGFLYGCLHSEVGLSERVFVIAPVRDVGERRQLQQISSPFTLSLINERTFFDLLETVGCDISDMGVLKKLVDDRNDLSHCNGQTCTDFDVDVTKYIGGFELLHKKFAPVVIEHMNELNTIDFGGTKDAQLDQLKAILSSHYISQRMLELVTPATERGGLTKKSNDLLTYYVSDSI